MKFLISTKLVFMNFLLYTFYWVFKFIFATSKFMIMGDYCDIMLIEAYDCIRIESVIFCNSEVIIQYLIDGTFLQHFGHLSQICLRILIFT